MDFTAKGKHRVMPADAAPCVWMAAGVLSYQLCERGCDCETCPLDAAIRSHFGRPSRPGHADELPAGPAREPLPADCQYSRNHCWVRLARPASGGHVARVGLEPGLAAALLVPKAIVFAGLGETLRRGQPVAWIVMEGGTLPIACPVDGRITALNHGLGERPHEVASVGFEGSWICELEVGERSPRSKTLMAPEAATTRYARDEARFRAHLSVPLRVRDARLGMTMADGGLPLQEISDMLGAQKYFGLLRDSFR